MNARVAATVCGLVTVAVLAAACATDSGSGDSPTATPPAPTVGAGGSPDAASITPAADASGGPIAAPDTGRPWYAPGSLASYDEFIDVLRTNGVPFEEGELMPQSPFGMDARTVLLGGQTVQVLEYETEEAAAAVAETVSPSGSSIGTSMVMWVDPPSFFLSGNLIVLYVGPDIDVVNTLAAMLGQPFAGQQPVYADPIPADGIAVGEPYPDTGQGSTSGEVAVGSQGISPPVGFLCGSGPECIDSVDVEPGPTPGSVDGWWQLDGLDILMGAIEAGGLHGEQGDDIRQPFFEVPGQTLNVGSDTVQVFSWPEAVSAWKTAGTVAKDGSSVGTTMISWMATPHFYLANQSIILYVGDNEELVAALDGLAGTKIAGPDAGEVPASPPPMIFVEPVPTDPLPAISPLPVVPGTGTDTAVEIVPAPIEEILGITIMESFPVQYGLKVVAGLPNGCAEPGPNEVVRNGNTVEVFVGNEQPAGEVACTAIYGISERFVALGSDFTPGETYTVIVNRDKTTTFTAQ